MIATEEDFTEWSVETLLIHNKWAYLLKPASWWISIVFDHKMEVLPCADEIMDIEYGIRACFEKSKWRIE